ncbi:hypothetical protein [Halobaculum roseum]|uniref:Uncharacterized protein n=1 Tax=Halobaculum roseum TaxID=2175149 RepID=A0ABD5MUC0_9EURY|nr:hypothetical protein [Halobaculum roseum]QZY04422.1 hypothetical protein K6T36_17250 [Halobaculum roseum]
MELSEVPGSRAFPAVVNGASSSTTANPSPLDDSTVEITSQRTPTTWSKTVREVDRRKPGHGSECTSFVPR